MAWVGWEIYAIGGVSVDSLLRLFFGGVIVVVLYTVVYNINTFICYRGFASRGFVTGNSLVIAGNNVIAGRSNRAIGGDSVTTSVGLLPAIGNLLGSGRICGLAIRRLRGGPGVGGGCSCASLHSTMCVSSSTSRTLLVSVSFRLASGRSITAVAGAFLSVSSSFVTCGVPNSVTRPISCTSGAIGATPTATSAAVLTTLINTFIYCTITFLVFAFGLAVGSRRSFSSGCSVPMVNGVPSFSSGDGAGTASGGTGEEWRGNWWWAYG